MTDLCNKFLKALSAIIMAFSSFAAVNDIQRGIFLMLLAILFHMWSEEK